MTFIEHLKRYTSSLLLLAVFVTSNFARQDTTSLQVRVTDQQEAVIVAATVTLIDASGKQREATTGPEGSALFTAIPPGLYTLQVSAPGFTIYENKQIEIVSGRKAALDVRLDVFIEKQEVTVSENNGLGIGDRANAGNLVLKGQDLEALPDDPEELAAALNALAGPAAGPNGGQILIDGFAGGRLPPKDSIREVKVNNNPFNAENDTAGLGRIEIMTKPGAGRLHGSTSFSFNDRAFNSRNPFAPSEAPFQTRLYSINVGGPIARNRSSFFLDFQRREEDDNEIINSTVLDPTRLEIMGLNQAVLTPRRTTSFSPRFDYMLNKNNTLMGRYSFSRTSLNNGGVGGFSLPTRAFSLASAEHLVQLTETAMLGTRTVNNLLFQHIRRRRDQAGDSSTPTINVLDAFLGGGSQVGLAANDENRWELENYATTVRGAHIIRVGVKVRAVSISDISPLNFGGTFVFAGGIAPRLDENNQVVRDTSGNVVTEPITSIERYRRTLLFSGLGFSPGQVRSLGGGASQYLVSSGDPKAGVRQVDLSGYVQDEWRMRPNLMLTLGLRYETQTNISSNANIAPRMFLAWAPGASSTGTSGGGAPGQPKFVLRAGFGIFYERFNENGTLQASRLNGIRQQQYSVTDPAVLDPVRFSPEGVENIPSIESLKQFEVPQVITRVSDNLQTPRTVLIGLQIERQLPRKFTFFGLFFHNRTRRALRLRDVNAPLPGTFDPNDPGSVRRPLGGTTDIYEYESTGRYNDYRMFLGIRNQLSSSFNIFANYSAGVAKSDTECLFGLQVLCFPADSNRPESEYGRVSFQPRHNFVVGGTIRIPVVNLILNPLVVGSTGRYFSITTGRDSNGDRLFLERPAIATSSTRPDNLRETEFGSFDLDPAPGAPFIERNSGEGPGFLSVNLRVSRAWALERLWPGAGGGLRATPSARTREKRYNLTLSLSAQNLFNRANLNTPVGNLSSPMFGLSTGTVGSFGIGQGNTSAGNRRITGQIRLNF